MQNSSMPESVRAIPQRIDLVTPGNQSKPFYIVNNPYDPSGLTYTVKYGKNRYFKVSDRDIKHLYTACKGKALPIRCKNQVCFAVIQQAILESQTDITSYLAPMMIHFGYAEYINGRKGLAFL